MHSRSTAPVKIRKRENMGALRLQEKGLAAGCSERDGLGVGGGGGGDRPLATVLDKELRNS